MPTLRNKNFLTPRLAGYTALLCLTSIVLGPAHAADGAQAVATPKPMHLKGVILTPGGKPAADAVIIYALVDNETHTVSSEQTLHPTATGTFDIVWTPDPKAFRYPILYVTSSGGVAIPGIDTKEMTVTLTPTTSVRVHLRDETGKPVAQVRVCPLGFLQDRYYSDWNEAIQDQMSAVTDETGTATLTGLPQGYSMRLNVTDPRYVQPDWSQNILLAHAAATPDATVQITRGGSLSGTLIFGPTRKPAAHINVSALVVSNNGERHQAITDAQGMYQIARLPPGSYNVSMDSTGQTSAIQDWTATQQSVTVTAGGVTHGVDLTLIHGGVLTGVVTHPKTGKPIPNVGIYVIGPAGDQYAQTDKSGRYTLHVPPGSQQVMLYTAPGMTEAEPQRIALADGETKSVNFQSTPPMRLAVVRGIVVGPNGKPRAGAKVTAAAQSQQEQDARQTTDAQGKFVFDSPGLTPDMRLYATAGGLTTALGTLATSDKPLTLRLTARAGVIVRGQVLTPEGKAVSGANAMLFRQNVVGFGGTGIDTTKTNAAGRYQFTPAVPDGVYSVGVSAQGFGYQSTKQSKSAAGKPLAFAALTLPRSDSFVGGTVVDLNGTPIAGADVSFISGDEHTLTDTQGRFYIKGATRGKAIVEVRAAQGRFASIEIVSGRDDTVITAKSEDEEAAESKRFEALLAADPTNHGSGANAVSLLNAACSQARQSGKKVFLVFHASWCGPCFLLHRFLHDPLVKPVMDAHFITQDIDIWEGKQTKAWENPGGDALYRKYGGLKSPKTLQSAEQMQGVPFFALLDASGKKIGDARMKGDNIGFPGEAGAMEFFLNTLKAAAPEMTAAELTTLKAGLQRDAKI